MLEAVSWQPTSPDWAGRRGSSRQIATGQQPTCKPATPQQPTPTTASQSNSNYKRWLRHKYIYHYLDLIQFLSSSPNFQMVSSTTYNRQQSESITYNYNIKRTTLQAKNKPNPQTQVVEQQHSTQFILNRHQLSGLDNTDNPIDQKNQQNYHIILSLLMQQQKINWADVVHRVETAATHDHLQLQLRQRQLKKNYMHTLQQQIALHQQHQHATSAEKIKERATIEEQASLEKQKRTEQKQEVLRKELELKGQNYQLIQIANTTKQKEPAASEHPFVKLCDEEQRRKELNKQKLKQQTNINKLQLDMKQQQKEQNNKLDSIYKQKYNNYVENYYQKKLQDRNTFKNKYLKLNNIERSRFLADSQHQLPATIEHEYTQLNTQQITHKNSQALHKQELDDVLAKFNKDFSTPSSSPAFLGRNPINYDRAKQMQYIDSSMKLKPIKPIINYDRIRTQGGQISNHKRHVSLVEDSPNLSKYYSKKTQTQQGEKSAGVGQPGDYNSINRSKPFFSELNSPPTKTQLPNLSTTTAKRQRKRFMTFDIILGERKQIVYM